MKRSIKQIKKQYFLIKIKAPALKHQKNSLSISSRAYRLVSIHFLPRKLIPVDDLYVSDLIVVVLKKTYRISGLEGTTSLEF